MLSPKLKVIIYPESLEDYPFADRVYRDCKDWGYDAFIVPDFKVVSLDFKVSLKVWYADATGIGILYKSNRKSGTIHPGPTLKYLERLLYEETLFIQPNSLSL